MCACILDPLIGFNTARATLHPLILLPTRRPAKLGSPTAPPVPISHANDFGSFEAEGHTIFFKTDYLDQNLKYHSPDPSDAVVTVRVITVMLADEY
jgi:hypothetical protein